jgi:tripartite-type tricarboxylate transporter receptor subunit TctC
MSQPGRIAAAAVGVGALALALIAQCARADEPWPAKPLRMVVPYAAGGFADIRARKVAQDLTTALGQQVVVDNRAGAGGVIGTDFIAKAAPDGYTIGMGNLAALAVNVSLMKRLPYDPVRDIAPVVLIERSPLILTAGPGLAAGNVRELIAYAKANPGRITFASSGVGGAHHLSGEMLRQVAGIEIVHVPYKGGAPAAADLLAGHVPIMFEMGYSALPSITAGKIRALAVTSSQRLAILSDVPTMAEAGVPGFESYNWQGIVAPARTPTAVIDRLNREINAILQRPDQRASIVNTGSQVAGGTPQAFGEFIRAEIAQWARVVREAKLQPE